MFEHAKETKIPVYGRQAVTLSVFKKSANHGAPEPCLFFKRILWDFPLTEH